MNTKERHIVRILKLLELRRITLKEAAALLSVSYRHIRRIYKNYKQDGNYCLIHGLQGRVSNRRIDESIRNKILHCFKENFRYCGPTIAARKLNSLGYGINRETLRKWLLEEGLWKCNCKYPKRKIQRRQYRYFGELVQLGIVRLRPFGQTSKSCSLLYLIDDATKVTISLLAHRPTVRKAMRLLGRWVKKFGIPMSICCGSKLLFRIRGKAAGGVGKGADKRGKKIITAFSCACDRLGIETIVKELKHERKYLQLHLENYKKHLLRKLETAGIGFLENAQQAMNNGFMDEMNKAHAEPPSRPQDFHVQLEADDNLSSVLCFTYNKIVSGDLLIRYKGRLYRINDGGMPFPSPYIQVRLTEWLDGSVHVYYGKRELQIAEVANDVVNNRKH